MSSPPREAHQTSASQPLFLPSADTASRAELGEKVPLDKLGPVVTLSRIPNWEKMTPEEQQRTVRIISKRNQARLEKLRESNP